MNEQKEIEEMKQVLVDYAMKKNLCFSFEAYHTYAKTLYGAGYRKAEEVKKETARKILKMIHEIGGCDATDDWSKGYDAAIDTAYEIISKKYGVEMDEDFITKISE